MSAPTRFLFVNARVHDQYWRERKDIDRRFPHFSHYIEDWGNLAMLRAAAREELRAAIIEAAEQTATEGFDSTYVIAV